MYKVLQVRSAMSDCGPGTQPLAIAKELRRRGIEVQFATSGGVFMSEAIKAGFTVHVIPTLAFDRRDPISTFRNILALRRIIRDQGTDVIHGHNAAATMCAYLGGLLAGKRLRTVNSVRGIELRPTHEWRNAILRILPGQLLAVCDNGRQEMIQRGVRPEKITVTYNGFDGQRFNPADHPRDQARAALGLSDKFVVGTVGVITGSKGHEILVRAAGRLQDEFPQLHLLFVGDGCDVDRVRGIAAELNVLPRITFAGRRYEVPQFLATMDLYCLPSVRGEFFPNSIVEAMAMGLPWIGSDIAGLSELTANGEAGWVSPIGDVDALCKNIRRMIEDPGLRQAMGKRARREVLERFTIEKVVDRTLTAYGLPLAEHAAAAPATSSQPESLPARAA